MKNKESGENPTPYLEVNAIIRKNPVMLSRSRSNISFFTNGLFYGNDKILINLSD